MSEHKEIDMDRPSFGSIDPASMVKTPTEQNIESEVFFENNPVDTQQEEDKVEVKEEDVKQDTPKPKASSPTKAPERPHTDADFSTGRATVVEEKPKKQHKKSFSDYDENDRNRIFQEALADYALPPWAKGAHYCTKDGTIQMPDKPAASVFITRPVCQYSDNPEQWLREIVTQEKGDMVLPGMSAAEQAYIWQSRTQESRDAVLAKREIYDSSSTGNSLLTPGGQYELAIADQNREWVQGLEVENKDIYVRAPMMRSAGKLTGRAAVMRMRQASGEYLTKQIPLWHSGFHVTIESPGDSRIVALKEKILERKIQLGRDTAGATFSNEQVYLDQEVMKLFKDCIVTTSLKDSDDLFKKIKIQDMDMIAHGLACVLWPDGYHFSRAVLGIDPDQDQIVSGKLNLNNLVFVNKHAFTESQRKHMVRRNSGSMEQTAIDAYQKTFDEATRRLVKINEHISVEISAPSIQTHLDHGDRWINNCIEAVDEIFGHEAEDMETRNRLIYDQAKASILCKHSHYISKIIFQTDDDEEIYTDQDTIQEFLISYSNDPFVRDSIRDAIYSYIEDAAVAIIATPAIGAESDLAITTKNFPNLVPLNAIYTFFTLAIRRAQIIQDRASR